jgi:chromosome segregation ATPase
MEEIQALEKLRSDITDLDREIEKFDNVFTHEQGFLEIQNSLKEDAKKNLDEVRHAIKDSLDGAQDFESTEVRLTAAVDSHKELTEFVEQNKITFTANTVGSEDFNDLQARIQEYQKKADASGFADEIYRPRREIYRYRGETEDGRETVTTRAMLEYLQDRLEEIKSKHDEILQNASLMKLDSQVVREEHRKTHQKLLSGYESRDFALLDKLPEAITLDDCQRILQDQIAAIEKKDSTLLDKAHKDLKRMQQRLSDKSDELEENLEKFQRYQSNAEHFFGTDDLLVGRWGKVLTSADLERRIGKLKEMQKSLVLKQMPAEVGSPVANEEKLSKDQIAKRAELQSLLEQSYDAPSGAPVSLGDAGSRLKRRFEMFNTVFELLGEVKDPTMFSTAAVRFAPDGNWMAQGLGNAWKDFQSAYKTVLSGLQADEEQLRNELGLEKRSLEIEISAIRYRLDDHRDELEDLNKAPENAAQKTREEAIQREEDIVVLEASIRQDEERLTLLEEDGSNPRSDNRAGGAKNWIKLDPRVDEYISRIQGRLEASRASQSSGGQGNDLIDESIVKDEERLATLRAEREGLTQITQNQQTIKNNISVLTGKLKNSQGQQQDLVKTYQQLKAETEEMRRRTEQLRNGRYDYR